MTTDLPPPLAAVASPGVPGAEPPPDPGLLLLHLGVEALEEVLLLLEVGGHTPLAADRVELWSWRLTLSKFIFSLTE